MKYPLTLIAVVILVGLALTAAVRIDLGDDAASQRFVIIMGVIATTITALLALLRSELNSQAASTAAEAASAAAERAAAASRTADRIEVAVAENTEVSRSAFREANDVNRKLHVQGEMFDRVLEQALNARVATEVRDLATAARDVATQARDAAAQISGETIQETHDKVVEVHAAVVKDGSGVER